MRPFYPCQATSEAVPPSTASTSLRRVICGVRSRAVWGQRCGTRRAELADMWATLTAEVRRDVAGALLKGVRVRLDKTVEILPLGEPVTITFTKRGTLPRLRTA